MIPAQSEMVGNLKSMLAALAEFSPEGSGWRVRKEDVPSAGLEALDVPTKGLSPQGAMAVARAVPPRETVATCDAGASRLLVVQKWQTYGPREFLTSNGLGSMGFAYRRARGTSGLSGSPVVAFTGDGGFMMAIAELQTAVRENLPIIVVVFDDQEIALIRVKQEIKGIPTQVSGLAVSIGDRWRRVSVPTV